MGEKKILPLVREPPDLLEEDMHEIVAAFDTLDRWYKRRLSANLRSPPNPDWTGSNQEPVLKIAMSQ